jgi:hypothetical protein
MVIINCTPHSIRLVNPDNDMNGTTYEPSGIVPRLSVSSVTVDKEYEGYPVVRAQVGDVDGLPNPQPGVLYIVSTMVAQAAKRHDVLSPDTGKTAIRDEKGQIIAVTQFQSFTEPQTEARPMRDYQDGLGGL